MSAGLSFFRHSIKAMSCALLFGALLPASALAQTPDGPIPANTVTWTVQQEGVPTADGRVTLAVHGDVVPGWHLYGLKQSPLGPTPLLVSLDKNAAARAAGAAAGSAPKKIHDPAFDLQTQFYDSAFTVKLPIRLQPHLQGPQQVSLSVRFQTCNGRICQPPKTVQLSAAVNPRAGG